ncbi:hypothetical protein [Rhodopirellula halodulae]|uniref:hypothetical protein n=1 Tax=Rhodopirellula halodulae TaxID=2894198 RepID=UPI001E549CB2|nr:hypothetical protein [Rhodopirellula sp. JC737]
MEAEPLTQWTGTLSGYWHVDLLKRGPFHLFAESPGDVIQPFRFDSSWSEDYAAVEFPLLCLIATFGLVAWLLLRRPCLV